MARLGDVCKINMGQSPDSSTYNKEKNGLPFFQGNADFGVLYPTVRIWCNEPTKIAHKGDVLLSVRAPIGAVNFADCECCIGRGLASLTVNEDIATRKYLWYALISKVDELNSKGTGSTFKAISKKILSETEIPIPPLDEQLKITAVLDKVCDLIAKRRQQLDKLDLLVKSKFVEMFGDPEINALSWEYGTIKDIVSDVRYGSSRKAVENGQYPYLRMNNITYEGELDLTDTKQIDIPDNELPKCSVRRGDVLFNRTNSKELVGKTCLYDRDELMVLAGFVIRVRVNEKAVPEFLVTYMNLPQTKKGLLYMCRAACGQANINATEFQSIPIYIPPVGLQKQFAAFKQQTNKSKFAIRQSLEKLETLKKSLMQQYFG